jgi:endoglucanase
MPRPVWIINDSKPGADLIAEVTSAFAACALVFRDIKPPLSLEFVKHARFLYDWMVSPAQIGKFYWQTLPGVKPLYQTDNVAAHMMLAAAWMHKLTKEKAFADDAKTRYGNARLSQNKPVADWSNPLQEAKLLLLEESGEESESFAVYLTTLQKYVDAQMTGAGTQYTPRGLWYVTPDAKVNVEQAGWGRLKTAAQAAHIALRTASVVDSLAVKPEDEYQIVWSHRARCFALAQMQYITGTGQASAGRSFITGWGKNPPKRPHHRGASCDFVMKGAQCTHAQFFSKAHVFPNVLPGGLVSGPNNVDQYADDHTQYVQSEVACDYNAALISGVLLATSCFPVQLVSLSHGSTPCVQHEVMCCTGLVPESYFVLCCSKQFGTYNAPAP